MVIIDSSKYIRSMELFKQESLKKRTEIYFLHLIKDPRAQIISFIKNRIRKNKPTNWRIFSYYSEDGILTIGDLNFF